MRRTLKGNDLDRLLHTQAVSRRDVIKTGGALAATSLLLPIGLLRSPSAAAATFDYYISPSGSNSNSGTIDSPWAISALSSKSQIAGKRVGLMDGTYRLSGGNLDYIQGITFGGSSSAPTTIEAVNPRKAVLTTNNGSGGYPQYNSIGLTGALQIEDDYVTIRGLRITDLAGHGINIHASNVLIEDCEVSNIIGQRNKSYADTNCGGIYFKESSKIKKNITVRNCLIAEIYNRTKDGSIGGAQMPMPMQFSNGVGDLFGVDGLVIEYCTFKRVGTPTYLKGNCGNVTMRYCYIQDCGSMIDMFTTVGNQPGNPATNRVYNNIAIVNHVGGPPSANVNGNAASVCEFYNNTVILKAIDNNNDAQDYGYITLPGAGSQTLRFYNNIVYVDPALTLGYGVLRFVQSTQNPRDRCAVMDYNCYNRFLINDQVSGQSFTSLSSWSSAVGKDRSSVVSTPQFANMGGTSPQDYQLVSSSTLKTLARVTGLVTGALTSVGAWGAGVARIGHTFGAVPQAPVDAVAT